MEVEMPIKPPPIMVKIFEGLAKSRVHGSFWSDRLPPMPS